MTKKEIDFFKLEKVSKAVEDLFKRMFPKQKVVKATKAEDTGRLIDYWIDGIPIQLKVKRCESRDEKDNIWVEFVTIRGKAGWVLGDAKKLIEIKFSMKDDTLADIYMVDMTELAKLSVSNTIGKKLVERKPTEVYLPYNRRAWGNKDIIARVPLADIKKLKGFEHYQADEIFSEERRQIEREGEILKQE